MKLKKFLCMLALLCAIAQGAWAQNFDVWDGVTTKKPSGYYVDPEDDWYITINSAAELAFVMQNYKPDPTYEFSNLPWPPFVLGSTISKASCEVNFILNADVDMTAGTWIPIGTNWEEKRFYKGFYGNGHTIRLKIDGATDNYQGMFAVVNGVVKDLRVDGRIYSGKSRLVGGICGYNTGTIENCWVSADVESDHWNVYHYADLGGVCGWNDGTVKYCCMTGNVKNTAKNAGVGGIVGSNYGTVQHCTFYGDVSVDYTQNNKYVGYQTKTMENCFDVFNQGEYDADGNMGLYRRAIKYPYALNFSKTGSSTYVVSAGGEEGASATRPGETVTLTKSGTFDMVRVEIKDADGNDISTTGDINGTLTFTMPKRDVYIAAYSWSDWPTQGTGTATDPYIISNAEEWKRFANNVSLGRDYSGLHVKLTNDISVSTMAGGSETNAFKGTFDGDGHTLTFNATGQTEKFVAPFRCVGGTATIKNLKTAGRISSNNMYAAGLVASIENVGGHVPADYWPSVTIENCQSSMAINNSGSGDLTLSGLVGRIENATLTIRGCVFDGSMSGSSAKGNAGFVSWIAPYGKVTFEDCIFAPVSISTSTDLCGTFARKDADASAEVSLFRCYLTQPLGEQQGILCICTTSAPSQLGSLVHDYGKLQAYENGLYYNGKYYLSPATSTNAGTEGDPYIISSTYEWDSFVLWIDEHRDGFTGEYVQLIADITVSTMVGTSEIPFSGTFLGNGHTITANITDTSNDGTALFRYINGATIKDLTVAGTITGGLHAAAIVGIARGTGNSIRNCVATANVSGGTHIGGILGHGTTSDIAISGCVFGGTMTGGCAAKGAIVGWGDNGGTKSVTDCLYVMADGQNTGGLNLVRQWDGSVGVNHCYKTTNVGSNGTYCLSFTTPPANLGDLEHNYGTMAVYENGILFDGIYYVASTPVSLADDADNSTIISDAHGYLADVTLQRRTLYKDGSWNTLCLPFDATKTGLLAKAVIKELDTETAYDGHKTGFEDGTLYLNFKDAESIVAGQPYIVKWNAVSQEHIINPSGEVIAALDFITEVPTFDGGQETNWEPTQDQGPKKMVDGNTATKYGLGNANPWVEFHYTKAITPKGYALMTAEDTKTYGSRNPKSWTIKAKNCGDADWTTLTTVDNTNKLPAANNQWTVFALDNSTAYQYFRFEATKNDEFQLAELRFCTVEPGRTEIENPTFEAVNLQADAPTAVTSEDGKVSFTGCYSPVSIAEEDRSVLYLSDNNTLYYPNAAMTIGAFRAHFQLNGITAGEPTSPVRAFVLNFGDGERNDINASGIITTNVTNSTNSDNAWYTLDGRKLNGRSAEGRLQGKKPTRAGVYINNGKKVVIK